MLIDFPAYGQWSNFSKIDGVPQVGTKLAMKMPGMSFRSIVTAAAPEQKLEWGAKILSESIFEGRHTFTLTGNQDGSTHLVNAKVFRGVLIWPVQGLFKQSKARRDNGYDGFNLALKRRVRPLSFANWPARCIAYWLCPPVRRSCATSSRATARAAALPQSLRMIASARSIPVVSPAEVKMRPDAPAVNDRFPPS